MSTHTASAARKNERVNLRVNARTKFLLLRAAEISGTALTEFVVQTALERADRLVNQPRVTRVSNEEFFKVLDLIENPPAPTDYLVEAMRRFN